MVKLFKVSVEVLLTWQSKRSSGGLVGPGGGPVDTMEVRLDPVEVWSDPISILNLVLPL